MFVRFHRFVVRNVYSSAFTGHGTEDSWDRQWCGHDTKMTVIVSFSQIEKRWRFWEGSKMRISRLGGSSSSLFLQVEVAKTWSRCDDHKEKQFSSGLGHSKQSTNLLVSLFLKIFIQLIWASLHHFRVIFSVFLIMI